MANYLLTSMICLLVAAQYLFPAVRGQQASSIKELRESAEPAGTDHTGDIVGFTAVGSGAEGLPRPWVCYTLSDEHSDGSAHTNVEWQTPDGENIVHNNVPADDGIATRAIGGLTPGIALARGTNYFSPAGDYCCVVTMNGTESDRRCVTFTPCPTLDHPTYAYRRINYDPIINVVTYNCAIGYKATIISGDQNRACESDGSSVGSWTGSVPTVNCTIVTCPPLDNPKNGLVTMYNNNYLSTATYSCNTGYMLSSSGDRVCGADGEWSGYSPSCPAVDCGALQNIANGTVDISSGTTFKNIATYTCNLGYTLRGNTSRTCQENAMWSSTVPSCKAIALSPRRRDNNTQFLLSYIGKGVSVLSCHLTTCCRDQDSPTGEVLGDWIGPDGSSISDTSDGGLYVTREMSSVSLHFPAHATVTGGIYCCVTPRAGETTETYCVDVQASVPQTKSSSNKIILISLGVLQTMSILVIIVLIIIVVRTKKLKVKQARYETSLTEQEHMHHTADAMHTKARMNEDVTLNAIQLRECPAYKTSAEIHNECIKAVNHMAIELTECAINDPFEAHKKEGAKIAPLLPRVIKHVTHVPSITQV